MNRQNSNTASSVQEVIQVENQSRKGKCGYNDEASNISFKAYRRIGIQAGRAKSM